MVQDWFCKNKQKKKSCSMIFSTRHLRSYSVDFLIYFSDGSPVDKVDTFKYLGLWIDEELTFTPHIDYTVKKVYGCLASLYRFNQLFHIWCQKKANLTTDTTTCWLRQILLIKTLLTLIFKSLTVLFNSLCRFVLRCPFRTHHCFYVWFVELVYNLHQDGNLIGFSSFLNVVYLHCPPYWK